MPLDGTSNRYKPIVLVFSVQKYRCMIYVLFLLFVVFFVNLKKCRPAHQKIDESERQQGLIEMFTGLEVCGRPRFIHGRLQILVGYVYYFKYS